MSFLVDCFHPMAVYACSGVVSFALLHPFGLKLETVLRIEVCKFVRFVVELLDPNLACGNS